MVARDNIIRIAWKLFRRSHSYYVKALFASLGRIFFGICVGAFFINIGLYMFGSMNRMSELQILSVVNMLLLSFVLLRDPKK